MAPQPLRAPSSRRRWLHAIPAASLPYLHIMSALAETPTSQPFVYHDVDILGTSLELQVAAPTKEDAAKAHTAALDEIERLRKILSTYDPATEISRLNASKDPLPASPELLDVLRAYERWQRTSKGAFSSNLGALVAAWKDAEKTQALPSKETLQKLAAESQKPLWLIDDVKKTVRRTSDATLNIDSLGKGFIASRAAAAARTKVPAVKGLLLNLGGDITALGSSDTAKSAPWPITIADPQHPEENGAPLTEIRLTNFSVATSGNYDRNYTIAAKKYSHLLDPRTGLALDMANPKTVASATVLAKDNAAANALACTLCILGPDAGLPIVKAAGAEALLVLTDGKQFRTEGFAPYEIPRAASAGASTQKSSTSQPAAAIDNPWPKDFSVSFSLQLLQGSKRANERPYLAVWLEDSKGNHVTTLAVWGNERKYLREMTSWWRIGKDDAALVKSLSRATRPVGKYAFTWDGTDQSGKPVPQGKYTLCIETAFEHGGHQTRSTVIPCTTEKSTATLNPTRHFESATIEYKPKSK